MPPPRTYHAGGMVRAGLRAATVVNGLPHRGQGHRPNRVCKMRYTRNPPMKVHTPGCDRAFPGLTITPTMAHPMRRSWPAQAAFHLLLYSLQARGYSEIFNLIFTGTLHQSPPIGRAVRFSLSICMTPGINVFRLSRRPGYDIVSFSSSDSCERFQKRSR
jgi:hypothetical protein